MSMSPEERELLNRSVSLAEENNKMLHSMKRSQRMASVSKAVYWIIIIGSAVWGYFILQPYIDQMREVYGKAGDILKNFQAPSQ